MTDAVTTSLGRAFDRAKLARVADWLAAGVAVSLPMTTPAPTVPPPLRVMVTVGVKPSAPNAAAFELVIVRFESVPVCRVIAPPETHTSSLDVS